MISDITKSYRDIVSLEHRQLFGQFFTPNKIADFMVGWVTAANPKVVLDPAFGLGAFYYALRRLKEVITLQAFEIDKQIINFFSSHNDHSDLFLNLVNGDYLSQWNIKIDGIICNPPYQRFQFFENREKVFQDFQEKLGIRLVGYTNIASAFLIKSLKELKPGGRLAYIMPSEFLNTGYGEVIKQSLLEEGLLKHIIRIDAEKDVFPDAITTVSIILVSRDLQKDPIKFSTIKVLSELEKIFDDDWGVIVPCSELNPKDKWLKYFHDDQISINADKFVPLSFYGGFSRGIATGANEFFTLSRSEIQYHDLPKNVLKYCITRSSQIRSRIFTEDDLLALRDSDAAIYVLDIKDELSPKLREYIRVGEEKGFDKRFLTRTRNPWYKLETRSPAPLLFGVFSRDGFKIVRNYTSSLNLTCYHGFYPNIFGSQYVDHLFLYFLSKTGVKILQTNMRRYGDKLDKFEPNDLNSSLVPSQEIFRKIPLDLIKIELENITKGKPLGDIEAFFNTLI